MSHTLTAPCWAALRKGTTRKSICSIPLSIASSSFSSSISVKEPRSSEDHNLSPPSFSSTSSPTARSSPRISSPRKKITYPKTNWSSPLYLDPAPPLEHSHLSPPLPDSAFASTIKNVAIGPGSSNATSLKHAERGLHMRITPRGREGTETGPHGTIRGVTFVNTEKARIIAAGGRMNVADESFAATKKRERQQAYLEREGGDYSRFLPPKPQQGSTQPEWQRVAAHALSYNTSIIPEARASLIRQVGEILQGRPFIGNQGSLARVGQVKEAPAPVPQVAAPVKKKGRK